MGMIARVLSWFAREFSGDLECDPGGGANIRSQLAAPPGVDAPPMDGDDIVIVGIQGTGRTVAVATFDTANPSTAGQGEFYIYSRDADKVPAAALQLFADKRAVLSNENGSATLGADGSHTLVTGDASATIAADKSITLNNGSGSIKLEAGGNVVINGVTIDTNGNISTAGTLNAADVTADSQNVTLSTHTHNTGNVPAPDPGS